MYFAMQFVAYVFAFFAIVCGIITEAITTFTTLLADF